MAAAVGVPPVPAPDESREDPFMKSFNFCFWKSPLTCSVLHLIL